MTNYKETDCVNKYRMPSIKRTLQDVEKLYKDKTANIQTFYSDKFLNDRGSIIDATGNRVVVTDWIAEQLIKDNLLENIGCICSPLPYLVDHPEKVEDSSPKTKGDREEEKVAHRLYERKDYSNSDIDIFIDYQVPILRKKESKAEREKNKDKKTRKPGKVDLVALSEDKKEIYLMELKKHNAQNNNDESLLRCVCECYTYWKQICHHMLTTEIAKGRKDEYAHYKIVPAVLVFEGQYQHKQFRSGLLNHVQALMLKLGVRFFVISSDKEYVFDKTYEDYIKKCRIKELPVKIIRADNAIYTPYDNAKSLALDFAIKAKETDKDNPGYRIDEKTFDNYLSSEDFEEFKGTLSKQALKAFGEGSGTELKERCNKDGKIIYPPKMASYGSSSRFMCKTANTIKEIRSIFEFEKKLHTTIGGTAHLDGYLEADKHYFIEAKCREPYGEKLSIISRAYKDIYQYITESPKTLVRCECKDIDDKKMYVTFKWDDKNIETFDLKQMICHLLGIATAILKNNEYTNKNIKFLYLIYNPTELTFEDESVEKTIIDTYYNTCCECESCITNGLFEIILEYLQTKKYCDSPANIKNIVDRFEFSICDQNTFKQKLGLEVAE